MSIVDKTDQKIDQLTGVTQSTIFQCHTKMVGCTGKSNYSMDSALEQNSEGALNYITLYRKTGD